MTAAWSVNQLAARAVAVHAGGSVVERRELLEALGLLEHGDRTITPDDTKDYALVDLTQITSSKDPNSVSPRAFADHGRRPEGMTTPPGLANLPPIFEQPTPSSKRSSPGTGAKSRKSRATRPPRPAPDCGSFKAYRRHKRRGEDVDDACAVAARAHWNAVDAEQRAKEGRTKRNSEAQCGSRSGYEKHRRENTPTCTPCRAANSRRSETDRLIAAGVNPDTAAILGEKASA